MKKFKIIAVLSVLLCLVACNTYKKQLAKATAFFEANPKALAPICEEKFPVTDSVGKTHVDSTHKANNVNYQKIIDSLQNAEDSLQMQAYSDTGKENPCADQAKKFAAQLKTITARYNALANSYRPCKPDTVFRTTPIYMKDNAEIAVLTNNLSVATDSLKITKHDLQAKTAQSKTRLWWIIGLAGAMILYIAFTVLKFLGKFGL